MESISGSRPGTLQWNALMKGIKLGSLIERITMLSLFHQFDNTKQLRNNFKTATNRKCLGRHYLEITVELIE